MSDTDTGTGLKVPVAEPEGSFPASLAWLVPLVPSLAFASLQVGSESAWSLHVVLATFPLAYLRVIVNDVSYSTVNMQGSAPSTDIDFQIVFYHLRF